jgi:DnaK suppressor protein
MKKAALKKLEEALLRQRQDLVGKIADFDVDLEGDEVDVIQAKSLLLVAANLSKRDQNRLKQIDEALQRISDKTFGDCIECGEEISLRRLELNPHFATCIDCAEHIERQQRQGVMR